MNLVAQRGLRAVYSWTEVCDLLQLPRRTVRTLVDTGKLRRRGSGMYPFTQSDLNQFIVRLNAAEISIGNRRK